MFVARHGLSFPLHIAVATRIDGARYHQNVRREVFRESDRTVPARKREREKEEKRKERKREGKDKDKEKKRKQTKQIKRKEKKKTE